MIKCAVFDMDGLMFDTERIAGIKLIEVAKEYGYNISWDTRLKMLGHSRKSNKEMLTGLYGDAFPFEDIMATRVARCNEYYQTHGLPVKKGLVDLLAYLKAQNMKVAVCSSTDYNMVMTFLEMANVINNIDYVIGGDMVTNSKPDPTIFLSAAHYFNLSTDECIVFEDSKDGILAAVNAHMKVICVPDLVKHPQELLDLTYATVESLDQAIPILEAMDQ